MNMNAAQSGMLKLHHKYQECLRVTMTAFLDNQKSPEAEWCAPEKTSYMMFMKDNLPTEYDNLMRLEENNF